MSSDFWKSTLRKGDVYQLMQAKTTEMRAQAEASIKKETRGRALPKELITLFKISDKLTTERYRELIETNLDRVFGYFSGKDEKLTLFLPVMEWKLPLESFKQPALLRLTGQTSLDQVMMSLGYKQENITEVIASVGKLKTYLGYIPIIWSGLLLIVILMIIGHFFLGNGLVDQINGTAWLLIITGLSAKLVGLGANLLFNNISVNFKPPMEPWVIALGKELVEQLFTEWQGMGLMVSGIGFVMILVVVLLKKQGKLKEKVDDLGFMKIALAFIFGLILDVVVFVTILFTLIQVFGGKMSAGVGPEKASVRRLESRGSIKGKIAYMCAASAL